MKESIASLESRTQDKHEHKSRIKSLTPHEEKAAWTNRCASCKQRNIMFVYKAKSNPCSLFTTERERKASGIAGVAKNQLDLDTVFFCP